MCIIAFLKSSVDEKNLKGILGKKTHYIEKSKEKNENKFFTQNNATL